MLTKTLKMQSFVYPPGERELVEFLTEEIVAERKVQKGKSVPSTLDGFAVKLTGADVELTKQTDKEKVVVSFNVNHSVDSEEEPEINPNADKPELGEMRSKPQFEVDIIKGNSTLSFTCTFLQGEAQEGEYSEFRILYLTLSINNTCSSFQTTSSPSMKWPSSRASGTIRSTPLPATCSMATCTTC